MSRPPWMAPMVPRRLPRSRFVRWSPSAGPCRQRWRAARLRAGDPLGQTTGRIADSFAHGRPLWSYVLFVPLSLLPWLIWPRLWRALRSLRWGDEGVRFCLAWAAAAFVLLSFISGSSRTMRYRSYRRWHSSARARCPRTPVPAGGTSMWCRARPSRRLVWRVGARGLGRRRYEAQVRIGSSLWTRCLRPGPA